MDGIVLRSFTAPALRGRAAPERRVNLLPYPGIERRNLHARGFRTGDIYGDRLEPMSGKKALPAAVVLARLYREFPYFETDEDLGQRHAEELVACYEASLRHSFSMQRERHLYDLTQVAASAISLHFGDNPGSNTEYLETVLIPGEPLLFAYQSPGHQVAAFPLLKRCADVLGYALIELRCGIEQRLGPMD